MTFKEFVDACNKELIEHPETANMEVVKENYDSCSDMFCDSESVSTYHTVYGTQTELIREYNPFSNKYEQVWKMVI